MPLEHPSWRDLHDKIDELINDLFAVTEEMKTLILSEDIMDRNVRVEMDQVSTDISNSQYSLGVPGDDPGDSNDFSADYSAGLDPETGRNW